MRTEILGRAVSVHYAIPTWFVVQILMLEPGIESLISRLSEITCLPTDASALSVADSLGPPLLCS
jgi:hypothetical protein